MQWRDLLYFSKGERNALSVLLILITIALLLLIRADYKKQKILVATPGDESNSTYRQDSIIATTFSFIESTEVKTISEKEVTVFPKAEKKYVQNKYKPGNKRTEKYPVGTIVELNTADTIILKKIPGIGSVFARRIIRYRDLLGGFYHVYQLSEVYGIDEEKYNTLVSWFKVEPDLISKLNINLLGSDSLRRHPYINNRQARVIDKLKKQKGKLTGWDNLNLLEEFEEADKERLYYYLSFD